MRLPWRITVRKGSRCGSQYPARFMSLDNLSNRPWYMTWCRFDGVLFSCLAQAYWSHCDACICHLEDKDTQQYEEQIIHQ